MPRMQILTPLEQATFETPPALTPTERQQHFDFPVGLLQIARPLRTPTNQVCFLVSAGYFHATKQFFPRTFHPPDVADVARQLGFSVKDIDLTAYATETRLRHQQLIREFYGFRPFDHDTQTIITQEIEAMVRAHLQPKQLFLQAVECLIREQIEVPGYYPLVELILLAINTRKQQLAATIERMLTPDMRPVLDALLRQPPSGSETSGPSKTAAYRLTLLKTLSQSTRPAKVKERIADLSLIREIYELVAPILDVLDLTPEGIRYYAQSVVKSEIFQIARRTDADRSLHLMAFIAHHYGRLQDNLVDVLLTTMQSALNAAQREHKERCYARREQQTHAVKTLIDALEAAGLDVVPTIRAIADAEDLTDTQKLDRIRRVLHARESAWQHLTVCLDPVKTELDRALTETDYHHILETRSVRLQNRISPILKALAFQGDVLAAPLIQAVQHFKATNGKLEDPVPLAFLTPAEHHAVLGETGAVKVSLYKVFLFIHVMRAIKSGTLNLEHSYKYRALDHYLIDRDRWQRDRAVLLEQAGLHAFIDPTAVLSTLDQTLHAQYQHTNQRLRQGLNPWVTLAQDRTLRIQTPKPEEPETDSLAPLFPEHQYVSLLEVLATVNRYSGFLEEFQHWQSRYQRPKPLPRTFFAGIIGLGCGIGTRKLARISRQLTETELDHTVNWYFTPDALLAANDTVLQLIDRLDVPTLYRRSPEVLHTASDGQKFEVRTESLHANYSFKYFGKGKGVSVYSFIDERHLLFYSTVISASERESAYVLDGLMHNEVVQSDIHSTDTYGYSEVLFGAMHLLGFSYAPRIKHLQDQRLYTFRTRQSPTHAQDPIRPSGYIDTAVIETQWDDILRFIATIQLKEATASDLFRRLNSYSQQHPLYRALKAFGQILKSIFILRYLDDVELRQAIDGQLNKIESAHRFTRAISVGTPREFLQAEHHEQDLAEGCKRLIKNAIIGWNYLYLSQKLEAERDPVAQEQFRQAVARSSVVAWQHINLLGEYDFSEERLQDSVGINLPHLLATPVS